MGCDWSKGAGGYSNYDEFPDGPYSLLSVSVEDIRIPRKLNSKRGSAKKRDKRKNKSEGPEKGRKRTLDDETPDPNVNEIPKGFKLNLGNVKPVVDDKDFANKHEKDVPAKKPEPAAHPRLGLPSMETKLKLDISKAQEIPREPTERQLRKEKLDKYEKECTRITDYLYVGGLHVAQNLELLKGVGISHIINCSRITSENFFPDSFTYMSIYINDAPSEDISCHIYDAVHFIDKARKAGKKILVHCTQGVSRSCSICIAYTMLKEKVSYDEAFQRLKLKRGICNPNAGFCSQLVRWSKRILDVHAWSPESVADAAPRLFKVDFYYPSVKEAGISAMLIENKGNEDVELSPDCVYIVDGPLDILIWIGKSSTNAHVQAAKEAVQNFQRYEGSPSGSEEVKQGEEAERHVAQLRKLRCLLPGGGEAKEYSRSSDKTEKTIVPLSSTRDPQLKEPAVQETSSPSTSDSGDVSNKRSFPQGGASCTVQTPRGGRSDAPIFNMKLSLNLPTAQVSPVKEAVEETKTSPTPSSPYSQDGQMMRMFEIAEDHSKWDELDNFDSDDLWPSKAFILLERSEDAVPAYVWIGSEFEGVEDVDDEEECHEFARKSVKTFTKALGITIEDLHVVTEGQEPDSFWDLFELG